ncbi:ABC transporter substrate-binding protein [Streptantibioticus cattleyicolor]|uniref:Uncharacterized protein n=1 Tax=Streptantibioticus cattleyicolor (strain ATCC 35852 / DSM 46488 / JCM 4925 / NBRC 14057 / NRRL 8057) TaxID=1003195 RepID=G8XED5_STREN|nr:ABC transporter substrate-binding protein [Streptantibioticus cattleyicolor]AEW99289.1 hypothetical protein SCATT_p10960 [Streptantibioticus cattleyicolor NRRL 8057 = DSM 46488]
MPPRPLAFVRRWFGNLPSRARATVVLLCVLALGGACYGLYGPVTELLDPPCMRSGATDVTHRGAGGECIGITDGAFVFDSALGDVERRIREEDEQVVRDHPHNYASVVLLLPISSDKGSIMSMTNAVEQVKGAFTAQYYTNRHSVEGISPYIRLLIGSDGYQANESAAAADVIERAAAREHIAAVSGLGLSLDGTQDTVRRLTARQIPVFGATVTADTFNNIRNFVRVSPGNADNTRAAVDYVAAQYRRAVLVEDENGGDSYDATMVDGFNGLSRHSSLKIVQTETYDTTDRDRPGLSGQARQEAEDVVNTRISQMPVDICAAQPAVVLFGGRGQDLGTLLHALSSACLDKPITLISGDDVTNLPDTARLRQDLADGRLTVEYAGVAHPDEWNVSQNSAGPQDEQDGKQGFTVFHTAFEGLFRGDPLSDGNTMMAYDATLAAVSAIRLTALPQPKPEAVAAELGALHDAHRVLGSTGPLRFTADYRGSDNGSNPVDKAIPILRLRRDGSSEVRTVEWPREHRPAP